ncbi:hypothetical protein BBJ28_00018376, partial [Nothophytophthora sp. Chile5]
HQQGEVTAWGDDDVGQEVEAVADEEEEAADAWEWQLRVVQRVSEGLTDLTLLSSGGFDFVVVLNLQQNVLRDLSPIVGMARTLRVLNASQNKLTALPGAEFWTQFRRLSLCFLSQNALRAWSDVEGLAACATSLLWLTLADNPLMALPNARRFVVNKLPFLKALDDFVATDQEVIQHARRSSRFDAEAPRLGIAELQMPLEFDTDDTGLRYAGETEAAVMRIFAHNSPSVRTQKLVRGFLSRRALFPRFRDVRSLIIHVQKHVRGFLLRQLIKRQICELVAAHGEPQLLVASVALGHGDLSPLARRAFEKLMPVVRRWRARFQAKKRAVAVKKIRFWCQLMHQRHARRMQQLLREQQEVWIYYTPGFEQELLTLAARAARRDPFLMSMTRDDRLELFRERCAESGLSVLRGPRPNENVVRLVSTPNGIAIPLAPRQQRQQHEEDEGYKLLRMDRDALVTPQEGQQMEQHGRRTASTGYPPLIRAFRSDVRLEDRLLVKEKQFIQQDLERIAALQRQHRQAVAINDADASSSPTRLQRMMRRQPRAVMVHLAQVTRELQQRLVICNRKILSACIKQQQRRRQQRSKNTHFSLTKAKIRARGHAPTRWERKKFTAALLASSSSDHARAYPKMKVFIPWTIDMYLQIVMSLERAVSMCSVGVAKAFALPYEDAKRVDAALLIQSAWRASRCHSRRNTLEVTLARALVCLQRWWRFRIGLRRRLDVLRACLLVGASINSSTLFMEASVYHALVDSWPAVQAVVAQNRCHEHRLHCRMGPSARVELTLSPGQLLLRNASRDERSILLPQPQQQQQSTPAPPSMYVGASKVELWASQRCSAYFPVWMPGAPDPEEESMSSRSEDATALLLVDGVQAEPTLMERELMLGITQPPAADMFAQQNPFRAFSTCQRVVDSATKVMELARRLSTQKQRRKWELEPSQLALEATSFVRLTFDSIDEARKRTLLLLCKTFDPVTKTYAQLYPLEALFGAALRHRQVPFRYPSEWALSQITTREESDAILDDSRLWLRDEFPSRWWVNTERKLESQRPAAGTISPNASQFTITTLPASSDVHLQQLTPIVVLEPIRPLDQDARGPPRVFPRPPQQQQGPPASNGSPTPLHLIVSVLSPEAEHHPSGLPHPYAHAQPPPPRSSSSSTSSGQGSSRHQLLTDRLGKPTFACIEDLQFQEQQTRERHVRDLREERERAMEAAIVDRRMLQRESATEVAGMKLDVDVTLQRMRFEQELDKLSARETLEQQRNASRRRQLTRQFETSFAAQTGALMRRAAREAVANTLEAREKEQQRLAVAVKAREVDALDRRRDAKSFWFVSNRREKQDVEMLRRLQSTEAEDAKRDRLTARRQRIREDKDIKRMLRLM